MYKRAVMMVLLVSLLVVGCSSTTPVPSPTPEQQVVLARMIGRNIAFVLVQYAPAAAQQGNVICTQIVATDDVNVINSLVQQIVKQLNVSPVYSLLISDALDLAALAGMDLNNPVVTQKVVPLIKAAADGYVNQYGILTMTAVPKGKPPSK